MEKRKSVHLPRITVLAIYIRDRFICNICGAELKEVTNESIRLVKFDKKGSFEPKNLLIACSPVCNNRSARLSKYRKIMSSEQFRHLIIDHLNKPLPIGLAKAILLQKSDKWPNPWKKKLTIEESGSRKGIRKEGATTKGNQNISKITRLAIYIRDNYTCIYCGTLLKDYHPTLITLNCFIPYPEGKRIPENLVTCCKQCSLKKGQNNWVIRMRRKGKLEFIEFQLSKKLDYFRQLAKEVLSNENTKLWNPWRN